MDDTYNENDDPALDAKPLAIAIAAAEVDLRRWLDELERLDADAASGDRTAVAKLRNPWGTSEAPGRAIPALRNKIASDEQQLVRLRAEFQATYIAYTRAKEMLNSHEESRAPKPADGDLLKVLAEKLAKAGVSGRDLKRASRNTLRRVSDLFVEDKGTSGKTSAEIFSDLQRLGVEGLVCLHTVVPRELLFHTPGDPNPQGFTRTSLPKLKVHEPRTIEVEPVRLPRTHSGSTSTRMFAPLWDAVGDSNLYSVYTRVAEPVEIACRSSDWEHLPPYQSFDEMLENVAAFAQHHRAAEKSAAKLAARRLLQEDSPEWGKFESDDPQQAALLKVCMPSPEILYDKELWEVWLQWHIKAATIHSYLNKTMLYDVSEALLGRWLFLLAGRFAKSEDELPVCLQWMFEWLELPYVMASEPATRIVVPNALLNAGAKDDPDVVYFADELQQRKDMILDIHAKFEAEQARRTVAAPAMQLFLGRLEQVDLIDEVQNLSLDALVDLVALMNEYDDLLGQLNEDLVAALRKSLQASGATRNDVEAKASNSNQNGNGSLGTPHLDELASIYDGHVSDLNATCLELLEAIVVAPLLSKLADRPRVRKPARPNEGMVDNGPGPSGDNQMGMNF